MADRYRILGCMHMRCKGSGPLVNAEEQHYETQLTLDGMLCDLDKILSSICYGGSHAMQHKSDSYSSAITRA